MSPADPSRLIAIALSGGVDSAVAAALLQEQGHRLVGVTMTLLPDVPEKSAVAQVADHLGIQLHHIDLTASFEQQIITPFITSYLDFLLSSK